MKDDAVAGLPTRIIRHFGALKLLALSLLCVALVTVALGLADVIRELDTRLMVTMAATGVLLGWALASSRVRGWWAGMVGPLLGFAIVFGWVGRLGARLRALLLVVANLAWSALRWLPGRPLPDWSAVMPGLGEIWSGLGTLLYRVRIWLTALGSGESVFDPVASALVWSLALWGTSAWAGWAVRRWKNPLAALAPAGVLLVGTLSYVAGKPSSLLIFVGAALLLFAVVGHLGRRERWLSSGIAFAELGADLATVTIPLWLVIVALAGLTPSVSVQGIVDWARRLDEHRDGVDMVAESLGVEVDPPSFSVRGESVLDEVGTGGLPRRHLLGAGPELSEMVVMAVSTGDLPPAPPQEMIDLPPPPRYYWRSVTFDRYVGSGWRSSRTETVSYLADEPVAAETLPTQRTVRQNVRGYRDLGGLLHVAGALVVVDQDYRIEWRAPGDDAFGALIDTNTYRAESLVQDVTEEVLRSAGTDYPQWVRDCCLALPETVPERVTSLAFDLAALERTPYDRALAIETHLRTYSYTLDVPAPPADRDVVDYFLFELQKGYCDYYSTSMVVLARAAGLPARLVIGYVGGSYEPETAEYWVTEADAHSWVEIYFPAIGWVEFEPTAGRLAINRSPERTEPLPLPEVTVSAEPALLRWLGGPRPWWMDVIGGIILIWLTTVVYSAVDRWRLRRLVPAEAIGRLYRRLEDLGNRVTAQAAVGATPYEFAALLESRLVELATMTRWETMLTDAISDVRTLAGLYVQASYSSHRLDSEDRDCAVEAWYQLRRPLWLSKFWRAREAP